MRIIKKKTLDDLLNKIEKAEGLTKKIEESNLDAEENEKLQRFGLYHVIRMEKYIRQGGDPTFGNLDGQEYTSEEFEYHLSHMLNDNSPEERYRRMKEAYYFHESYIEMEKLDFWRDRADAKYCTGYQCVPTCPYSGENGRIEDEQVMEEFLKGTEILEIKDYENQLGKELVQSIINDWNLTGN